MAVPDGGPPAEMSRAARTGRSTAGAPEPLEPRVPGVAARRTGGFVEFQIADDGAGIPTGFINSVFDRFSSLPRGASRGGVGLGLSIVKAFVALHGGTVEIASEEGRGTTVTVRLPLRPALDAAAAE